MPPKTPKLAALGCALGCVLTLAAAPMAADDVPKSAADVRPLLIGAEAPAVSLQDLDGKTLELGATLSAKPSVLIFYRGGW